MLFIVIKLEVKWDREVGGGEEDGGKLGLLCNMKKIKKISVQQNSK